MRVAEFDHLDPGILDQLGAASGKYSGGELDYFHLAQLRRGSGIRYVVAHDARGKPLGLLPVYTAAAEWDDVVNPAALFETPVDISPAKLCLAGSPSSYENHLALAASIDGPEAGRVAQALAEGARSLARDAGCPFVMFPYLNEEQSLWLDEYRVTAAAVNVRQKAVLPVIWSSFEDYVRWLPHGKRGSVRRERRRFLQSTINVREQPLAEVAADVALLVTQTVKRYGRDVDSGRMASYFMLLGTHLDDDCFALVAYRDDRPVAASIIVDRGDRWMVKAWGCDYAALADEELYFNLVYYEPISRAIDRGAELIDFGVGALDPKRWRGCATEQLQTILIPV